MAGLCHLHYIRGEARRYHEDRHVSETVFVECPANLSWADKTLKVPENPFPDLCSMYSALWKKLDPRATVSIEPTIEAAIRRTNQISVESGEVQVFVTGSLHLVGGALNLLRP